MLWAAQAVEYLRSGELWGGPCCCVADWMWGKSRCFASCGACDLWYFRNLAIEVLLSIIAKDILVVN